MKKTHVKTLTWLLVSGLVIWASAYIEIRDIHLSFMTALWAGSLKTPFYWVHEALWERKC